MTSSCYASAGSNYLTYGLVNPINYPPNDLSDFMLDLNAISACAANSGSVALVNAAGAQIAAIGFATGQLGNGPTLFTFFDSEENTIARANVPADTFSLIFRTDDGDASGKSLGTFTVTHNEGPTPSAGIVRRNRQMPACKMGQRACPAYGGRWACTDVESGLNSCGGCPPINDSWSSAYDCTSIEGVLHVSCVKGACNVTSCEKGYKVSQDWTTCSIASLE